MLAVFVLVTLFFVADLCLSGPIVRKTSTAMSPTSLARRDSTKYVVAHFMVGNSNPYTQQNWLSDVVLAHENGIDGFALNVGSDSWQPQQVANA